MSLKRCLGWLALSSMLALTGCCNWCEKHCAACHQTTAAASPAPTCCVPCYSAPQAAPVVNYQAPPPPQQGWNRTLNCTCTQN